MAQRELNIDRDQTPDSPVSEFTLSGSNTPPPHRASPRDIATPLVIDLNITQPITQYISQPFMLPSTQASEDPSSNPSTSTQIPHNSSNPLSQSAQASQHQSNTMVAPVPNWLKGSPISFTTQTNDPPKNADKYLPKY